MTPEPTPVDGIWPKPRDEKPSVVMVTTESRTEATTSVSSGALGAGGRAGGDRDRRRIGGWPGCGRGANGPATSAAVPPAARTADRIAATATEVAPRREPPARRGIDGAAPVGVGVGVAVTAGVAGVQAKGSVWAGAQAGVGVGALVGGVEAGSAEVG